MLITPEERVVELFVKIVLLFVLTGILILLLCGCSEPTFRCSRCRSTTKLVFLPMSNGKVTSLVPVYRTEWECEDTTTHGREEREDKVKRNGERK